MENTLIGSIASVGLLIFSLSAGQALAQEHHGDESWYQARQGFFTGNNWHMRMFDRVRDDLSHVQATDFAGRDEFRIVHTEQTLNELQGKLAANRYDQPQLDEVIGGLQRIVADNRLSPRDRDILNDDLNRLRDYRDHHDNWR